MRVFNVGISAALSKNAHIMPRIQVVLIGSGAWTSAWEGHEALEQSCRWESTCSLAVETQKAEQQAMYAKEYVMKVEAEILEICDGFLGHMDKSPILSASARESGRCFTTRWRVTSTLQTEALAISRASTPRTPS